MANQADGHIIIDTKLDTGKIKDQLDDLNKQLQSQVDEAKKYLEEIKKLQQQNNNGNNDSEIDKVNRKLAEQEEIIKIYSAQIEELSKRLDENSQKTPIPDIEAKKADLLTEKMRLLEEQLKRTQEELQALHDEMRNGEEEPGGSAPENPGSGSNPEVTENPEVVVSNLKTRMQRIKDLFAKLRIKEIAGILYLINKIGKGMNFVFKQTTATLKLEKEWKTAVKQEATAMKLAAQPFVDALIPALITAKQIIAALATLFASLMARLMGTTLEEQQKRVKELEKKAKNAEKYLASFDEIEKVGAKDSDLKFMSEDEAKEILLENINKLLTTIKDHLPEILTLALGIGGALLAWKLAPGFMDTIGLLGGQLLKMILGAILLIGGAILTVISAWDAFQHGLDLENMIGLFVGLTGVVLGLFLLFGETAAAIGLVIAGITLMIVGIHDLIENGAKFENVTTILVGLSAVVLGLYLLFGVTGAAIGMIVGGLAILVLGVKDMIENGMNLHNVLLLVSGIILTGLGISLLTGSVIPALISAILGIIVALVYVTGHGEELVNGFRSIVEGFAEFFKGVFTGDMEMAAEGLSKIWDGMKQAGTACWEAIKDGFRMLVDWIDEMTGGKFTKVCNGIINVIESVINFTIDGINWIIEKLNQIGFTAPEWIPVIGGEYVGVSLPTLSKVSIPRLAQGAVIPANHEFLSVLGDQKSGTNIEAPLETITEAMRAVLGEGGGQRTVVFEVDKRQFAKIVFDLYGLEDKRVGARV